MIHVVAFALALLADRHAAAAGLSTACAPVAGVIDTYSMAYGNDAEAESLDLYYPDAARGEPLIVFVHGGAWS